MSTTFEENECRVTGVFVELQDDFAHNPNLCTMKIKSRSRGKSFLDAEWKTRREYFHVELHDRAAMRAKDFVAGDVLMVKGQLATREWVGADGAKHIRVIILVSEPGGIGLIGKSPRNSGEGASVA